jgi:hypothetical protein
MSEMSPSARNLSPDNMELWFTVISNEIALVTSAINKKEGVFLFKKHVYSEDELMSSPSMQKIQSTIGTIENIFESWMANSAVTDERRKFYWDSRLAVERKLGELRALIIERKPTFWEQIVSTITRLIRFVMAHLPMLPDAVMKRLGISFSLQQKRLNRVLDIDPDEV